MKHPPRPRFLISSADLDRGKLPNWLATLSRIDHDVGTVISEWRKDNNNSQMTICLFYGISNSEQVWYAIETSTKGRLTVWCHLPRQSLLLLTEDARADIGKAVGLAALRSEMAHRGFAVQAIDKYAMSASPDVQVWVKRMRKEELEEAP
jgi:hypothetical protein